MFLTFCEGIQRVGQAWSFTIMMVAIVWIVVRFQQWQKSEEYRTVLKLNETLNEEQKQYDNSNRTDM